MVVDFLRLGFDIRNPPSASDVSADALAWPQAQSAYQSALSSGFKENSFELIEVASVGELGRLNEVVRSSDSSAVIVELAVFPLVATSQSLRWLAPTLEGFPIDDSALSAELYDVCDLDGFFSAFAMGIDSLQRGRGSSDDALLDACIIAQAANFLVPSHAPFVTVRVRVLRP